MPHGKLVQRAAAALATATVQSSYRLRPMKHSKESKARADRPQTTHKHTHKAHTKHIHDVCMFIKNASTLSDINTCCTHTQTHTERGTHT